MMHIVSIVWFMSIEMKGYRYANGIPQFNQARIMSHSFLDMRIKWHYCLRWLLFQLKVVPSSKVTRFIWVNVHAIQQHDQRRRCKPLGRSAKREKRVACWYPTSLSFIHLALMGKLHLWVALCVCAMMKILSICINLFHWKRQLGIYWRVNLLSEHSNERHFVSFTLNTFINDKCLGVYSWRGHTSKIVIVVVVLVECVSDINKNAVVWVVPRLKARGSSSSYSW